MYIVRRKDPPAYPGAKTYWQTVARRDTLEEAQTALITLRKIGKKGVAWWCGEEGESPYENSSEST